MEIDRKSFLLTGGGLLAGTGLGAWIGRATVDTLEPPPAPPTPKADESYSQCGEDLIVKYILQNLAVGKIDYLDVGAYDPIHINNTYYFYKAGCRGVLIEPNRTMCDKIRAARPEDVTLEAGVGVTAAREADYYVMTDASWNTFSKEEAENQTNVTKGSIKVKEVIKMPLLDINEVMAKHFPNAPAFLSVDVQGLELSILKSIDYARFRPKTICVETLITGTHRTIPEIAAFMDSKGYVVRGMSFVNSIFVDSKII